ncbi:dihydroorotate dehydrogenase electron transfer subunit [Marinitoga hydrogenitolerans DSM 16785]|uniref:Dihydroorotate dehydrogenase electron transfer subunit n=1 Tax=Marinitoga hydrogenitolerans (strain DSM 16785 / JCM 12826 / AT1271) TaxID=1122195 RepID=A0A1M4VJA3_MARH1|nr:hypothetical protein [Marinitoga hydrogenitolerans]SHE68917.1 dihydroorotate dehydrogenase electron transfer subunit [Marinitoga hydrogenitolerans DSM 16785]
MKAVVKNIETTKNYILLTVETEKELKIEPGQFVMLKLKHYDFGKPFSVTYQEGKIIKFLIAVVGEMTKEMLKLKTNEEIAIRGAYGIPFIEKIDQNKKYVLLGGDCGSAPLIHFSEKYPHLVKEKIYGFATSEIKKILNVEGLHIDKESNMNLLEKANTINISSDDAFLICGSMDMIKTVKNYFKNNKIYASLEARMACGIGICKGCPIKTTEGIKMICKDGPIFDLSEVELEW